MLIKRLLSFLIVVLLVGLIVLRIRKDGLSDVFSVTLGGPQTLTGTLVPAELSMTRRGTHLLKVDGHEVVYVESTTVNLRNFEEADVVVTGTVEANVGKNMLPVIIATALKQIEIPSRTWNVPPLKLSVHIPLQWNAQMYDDGIAFTITGSSVPLLKMHRTALLQLPEGTPLVVGGERAVRSGSGSTAIVFIQHEKMVISVEAGSVLQASDSSSHILARILKSVVFTAPTSSSGTTIPTGGSGSTMQGMPCGGVGGILCPVGSYCAITDTASGIGTCRKIGS